MLPAQRERDSGWVKKGGALLSWASRSSFSCRDGGCVVAVKILLTFVLSTWSVLHLQRAAQVLANPPRGRQGL